MEPGGTGMAKAIEYVMLPQGDDLFRLDEDDDE
jgi:hypothetical protein